LLKLVKPALRFMGPAAEADGAAAEAELVVQRYVWTGGVAESLQSLETEADDFSGEARFILGFGVAGREHLAGGEACGGVVIAGAGQEQKRETPEDGVPDTLQAQSALAPG
jgi:hypothetical protein